MLISFSIPFELRLRLDTETTTSSQSSTPLLLPSRSQYLFLVKEFNTSPRISETVREWDSNIRPSDYTASAQTTELCGLSNRQYSTVKLVNKLLQHLSNYKDFNVQFLENLKGHILINCLLMSKNYQVEGQNDLIISRNLSSNPIYSGFNAMQLLQGKRARDGRKGLSSIFCQGRLRPLLQEVIQLLPIDAFTCPRRPGNRYRGTNEEGDRGRFTLT